MQAKKKVTKQQQPKVQPWHIALFVLAVVLVAWKAAGYIGEQRKLNDVKYDKAKSTYQSQVPRLQWREEEK